MHASWKDCVLKTIMEQQERANFQTMFEDGIQAHDQRAVRGWGGGGGGGICYIKCCTHHTYSLSI